MKESIRRSQREHASALAATVRSTMKQNAGAAAPTPEPAPRRRYGSLMIGAGLFGLIALAAVGVLMRQQISSVPGGGGPVAIYAMILGSGQGEVGQEIFAGTMLETSGADQRVALTLQDGSSVRLDTNSRLEVTSASVLRLERGAVYIDAAAVATAIEVRTSLGVVRDIGTQFEVRLLDDPAGEGATGESAGPSLRVQVREGAIVLDPDARAEKATAGEQLSVDGAGTVTRSTVSIHGSHWDWVQALARFPDIEGRPLTEFLEWVTREGGWSLAFVDPAAEELATTIQTYGDVRELTLEQATEVVLQSSDMDSELKDGVLLVRPASAGESR